ncbi:hypothetical protein GE061_007974 [Apolygus lucorum]|uniref:Uncharacterized protein n=1 Tax=Apolygus lucorum TaxID=248454 RepID=A0A8S9WNG6_APOLU|nr:hypothetical protein GE061_007974 [Apolygus lucorum]
MTSRLIAFFKDKLEETAFGVPPKKWKTLFIYFELVYFELVNKLIFSLPRTEAVNEDGSWEHLHRHVAIDYFGSLLSFFVAPFIDNYCIHQYVMIVCHCVISVLAISFTTTVFLPQLFVFTQWFLLAMSFLTQFTKPIFLSYALMQLPERVGPPSKFVITIYYTTTYILSGFLQLSLRFENYKEKSPTYLHLLSSMFIATYPLVMGAFVVTTLLYKNQFRKAESKPGDTFLAIKCMAKATPYLKSCSGFDVMLNRFDYNTVFDCKKASKVYAILLAFSFNSTTLQNMDLPWIFQYYNLVRSGIFAYTDMNSLYTIFTGILIPIVEYLLIPFMRKLKVTSVVPTYALTISLAYVFSCFAGALSIWIQAETEAVQTKKLEFNTARVFLMNSFDTYSYVQAPGFPNTRIPAASVKSYLVGDYDPKTEIVNVNFKISNLYYGVKCDLVKPVLPRSTSAYMLTFHGAYEFPVEGFKEEMFRIVSNPLAATWPTLTFLCPKNITTDEFFPWCDAQVKLWFFRANKRVVDQEFDLLEVGNGHPVLKIPPDTIVSIQMRFKSDFNHEKTIIEFEPAPGGRYILLVWAGDVHLKVKYRVITAHTPPPFSAFYTMPQIICRSLGMAFAVVSVVSLIKINVAHSLFAISYSLLLLTTKIYNPLVFFFSIFNLRGYHVQLLFVIINFLMFFPVFIAIRYAIT